MSRQLLLCGLLTGLTLASPAAARADDAVDKAAARVVELGGHVVRAEMDPGKPVFSVTLSGPGVTDTVLKELAPWRTSRSCRSTARQSRTTAWRS